MNARTLEDLPPILLPSEAAEVLRLHVNTIYLMIERKVLRAARVGRGTKSIRIEKAEIARIMREGTALA
jgi:excisionase family DNA binding protein